MPTEKEEQLIKDAKLALSHEIVAAMDDRLEHGSCNYGEFWSVFNQFTTDLIAAVRVSALPNTESAMDCLCGPERFRGGCVGQDLLVVGRRCKLLVSALPKPFKLDVSREWCEKMAHLEEGHEVGAGRLLALPEPLKRYRPGAYGAMVEDDDGKYVHVDDLGVSALLPETAQTTEEEKDHGAGLIHQTIPDVEGTEPRLNSMIARVLAALESDATTEQREAAFNEVRDHFFPLIQDDFEARPFSSYEVVRMAGEVSASGSPRYHVYGIRPNGLRVGLDKLYLSDVKSVIA